MIAHILGIPADHPDAMPLLVQGAHDALEGGVVLSLQDWAAMGFHERAAFTAAGRRLAIANALRVGLAASGESGRVLGEVDGGQAHDDALLSRALRACAEVARGSR